MASSGEWYGNPVVINGGNGGVRRGRGIGGRREREGERGRGRKRVCGPVAADQLVQCAAMWLPLVRDMMVLWVGDQEGGRWKGVRGGGGGGP